MRFSFASFPGNRPQVVGLRALRSAVTFLEAEQEVRNNAVGAAPSGALVWLGQLIVLPVEQKHVSLQTCPPP